MADVHQLIVGDLMAPMPNAAPGVGTFSFVNATDQVECIFQVPDDKGAASLIITRLGYLLSSVTGTSPVMKISLQGVDASGNPDGTIKGGGSPASQTFTPTGSNTWNWVTLANSFTANRGDWLAWVIAYSSGTINASNRPIIGVNVTQSPCYHPYAIGNVATVRTRVNGVPIWGFGTAGRAFGMPLQTITATAFSTANERALRFMLDANVAAFYTVIGLRLFLTTPAAGKSTKFILYSGTTPIATATWDSDFVVANATARVATFYFQDATLPVLSVGVEYRLAVSPQDAANNVALHQFDFATAADLEALPGGQNWYLSTRAGAAWTDVTTSRPYMALILADVTTPPPAVIVAV